MNQDSKFALLAIGVPFLGLLYCGMILGTLILFPWTREHPIVTGAVFVVAPSLISGSIWLFSAVKGQNKRT